MLLDNCVNKAQIPPRTKGSSEPLIIILLVLPTKSSKRSSDNFNDEGNNIKLTITERYLKA